ncbi:alanyl-tRNA editing protein [Acinetobacter sp.]|jgi:Ser-tRNA(Ala) deacylase AlaX|uniref:alanyl-tRNA editing protein n=1 Tax=Acinetobacter sp. TaxID=472 RepID=UPI00282BF2DA|nr:alanyl-tRNA editing protein [Acinetobacter sp.]MDR0235291.1 alanyl-tRNA editing protein [Acinetobacter sp.]
MTQALYLSDLTSANVDVLSCELNQDGLFAVRLAQTPFHPQGGGQPSDLGTINDVDVVHVVQQAGDIIHYCQHEISLGQAFAQVAQNERLFYSRLHSAGHLIGHIMQGFGWHPVKAQHWPEDAKVQFTQSENAQDIDQIHLQAICQQYIRSNLPRITQQNEQGYREVGFGDLPKFPCGGTHVQSLSDIGCIEITAYKIKKAKLTVSYKVIEIYL